MAQPEFKKSLGMFGSPRRLHLKQSSREAPEKACGPWHCRLCDDQPMVSAGLGKAQAPWGRAVLGESLHTAPPHFAQDSVGKPASHYTVSRSQSRLTLYMRTIPTSLAEGSLEEAGKNSLCQSG